jgi:hypothetical protein
MVIDISGYYLWWLVYQDTVYSDWYIRILYGDWYIRILSMVIGISGYCLWWLVYQDTVYGDWYIGHHRQYPDIPITLEVSWYINHLRISWYINHHRVSWYTNHHRQYPDIYCLWWLVYRDTTYGDWYIRILSMVIGISGYCLRWLVYRDTSP